MKFDWRELLAAFARMFVAFFGLGIPLAYANIVVTFSAPPYVIRVFPWLSLLLLVVSMLAISGFLKKKALRVLWMGFLVVFLGAGAYMGLGAYRDSIPTMDDRALMLHEYDPFREGTKAVKLDEPSTLQLTREEVLTLRLDGATALYPLYSAFVQATWPEPQFEYKDNRLACTNTVYAYERLITGETDLIFVAGPSQAQLDMAAQAGVELHLTPIGKEAFVFFVNSRNPVTSLTVEQIQGIYSGQITNWKEVGGKNQSIRPFQRAENSGSQTALQSLMGDLPLLEPEEEDVIADMGGIIRQVASYRNYKNAIGFSFRFYSTEMVADDQIRLLALNGVEPTKETIRDGSYPISSYFYAVTAAPIGQPAPQETDPLLSKFLDWVLSEQGQEIVERTGYVALDKG